MKLTKIILICLFLMLILTGVAFAKSGISINASELPYVTLGINISNGVSIINDGINNFNVNNMNIYTALQNTNNEENQFYYTNDGLALAGVITTIVGMIPISIGGSFAWGRLLDNNGSNKDIDKFMFTLGTPMWLTGIVMSIIGIDYKIIDYISYGLIILGGIEGIISIISLIVTSLSNTPNYSTATITAGIGSCFAGTALLLLTGLLIRLVVELISINIAVIKEENNSVTLKIREEDGAIGLSW